MDNSNETELLIVGKPGSGKSVFLGQFYTRLRRKKSEIKLSRAPGNLKIIEAVNKNLSEGNEPETTPAGQNEMISLQVTISDREFVLNCPEYGGEQIRQLIQYKEIKPEWQSLLKRSNAWILFIRPTAITNPFDLSTKQYTKANEGNAPEESSETSSPNNNISTLRKVSEQTQLLELVQLMLHAKGVGSKNPITDVKLTVVLTCWDKLDTSKRPAELFEEQLPLLYSYINTNWDSNMLKVLGLSAQGISLDTDENKNLYLNELPENFGYFVSADGKKDKDITLLIKEAIF